MKHLNQQLRKYIVLCALVIPFLGCNDETNFNSRVDVSISPEVPIIIKTDTTIGAGDLTMEVKAPWFLGAISIFNNSIYELRIPAIRVSYEALGSTQAPTETTWSVDDACTLVDDDSPARTIYATIASGATFIGDADCDNVDDGVADREFIYFSGLPESDFTAYMVTITVEGYLFDSSNTLDPIVGRVNKTVTFSTQ